MCLTYWETLVVASMPSSTSEHFWSGFCLEIVSLTTLLGKWACVILKMNQALTKTLHNRHWIELKREKNLDCLPAHLHLAAALRRKRYKS